MGGWQSPVEYGLSVLLTFLLTTGFLCFSGSGAIAFKGAIEFTRFLRPSPA